MNDEAVFYNKEVLFAENMGSLTIEVDGDGEIDFDIEVDHGYHGSSIITHTLTIADLENIIEHAKYQKDVWQKYVTSNR